MLKEIFLGDELADSYVGIADLFAKTPGVQPVLLDIVESIDFPYTFISKEELKLKLSKLDISKCRRRSLPFGSIIVPVFKDGDSNDAKNNRPVTILSSVAKVLESIIHENLALALRIISSLGLRVISVIDFKY